MTPPLRESRSLLQWTKLYVPQQEQELRELFLCVCVVLYMVHQSAVACWSSLEDANERLLKQFELFSGSSFRSNLFFFVHNEHHLGKETLCTLAAKP